jgi:hypothetical protein
MRNDCIGNHVFLALILAATAAVVSARPADGLAAEARQLLMNAALPDLVAAAGAVGGDIDTITRMP